MNTEPPPGRSAAEIEDLIEQSSFGAPGARALSDRTSPEIVRSILDSVADVPDRDAAGLRVHAAADLTGRQAEIVSSSEQFVEVSEESRTKGSTVATDASPSYDSSNEESYDEFRKRVGKEWRKRLAGSQALSRERQSIQGESDSDAPGGVRTDFRDGLVGAGGVVRPYVRTGGRTRGYEDLPVEALIFATDRGRDLAKIRVPEHKTICELCAQPVAIFEVAARVSLPLGVVRVLVGDLLGIGLVDIQRPSLIGGRPSIGFMERVLDGLLRKL